MSVSVTNYKWDAVFCLLKNRIPRLDWDKDEMSYGEFEEAMGFTLISDPDFLPLPRLNSLPRRRSLKWKARGGRHGDWKWSTNQNAFILHTVIQRMCLGRRMLGRHLRFLYSFFHTNAEMVDHLTETAIFTELAIDAARLARPYSHLNVALAGVGKVDSCSYSVSLKALFDRVCLTRPQRPPKNPDADYRVKVLAMLYELAASTSFKWMNTALCELVTGYSFAAVRKWEETSRRELGRLKGCWARRDKSN